MGVAADVDAGSLSMDVSSRRTARRRAIPASRLAVGRVGALAVALGIGAAVFALPGLAAAETSGSSGASGTSSSAGSSAGSEGDSTADSADTSSSSDTPDATGASEVEVASAEDETSTGSEGSTAEIDGIAEDDAEGDEVDPEGGVDGAGNDDAGADGSTAAEAASGGIAGSGTGSGGSESAAQGGGGSSAEAVDSSAAEVSPDPAVQDETSPGNGGATGAVPAAAPQTAMAPGRATASATSVSGASKVLQRIHSRNEAVVRSTFSGLLNWVATLPVNPVTNWLEGALLLTRKWFFNESASVSAVQDANTSTLVTGKIHLIDPEGDGWKVELVGDPGLGTVVLGAASHANGIGSVKYTYTPGQGYTGDDQFVVKVTPTALTFNALDPFGILNTRYYTVVVGDAAEAGKTCFGCSGSETKDTFHTHLFLSNAAATVMVEKRGVIVPRYHTTVTLPASTAAASFSWMDTRGNMGTIPVDQMLVEDWSAYEKKARQNAVKPLLSFNYSDQGTAKSVFVDVSSVTKNDDGTYTLSGLLMDDAPAQEGRIDRWDFLGINYKAAYQNFLNASGLKDCKSGQVCTSVSTVGILGATTLSPSGHRGAGGRDYPLPTPGDESIQASAQGSMLGSPMAFSAIQTALGSMGPGTATGGAGNGTEVFGNTGELPLELTAMIPWGTDGSFIAATNLTQSETANNGIFLYTAQAPNGGAPTWTVTQLVDNTWNAAVNVMTAYDQVVTDSNGTPIPTTYTGTAVSGTTNAVTLAVPGDIDPSSLIGQAITGTGIAPDTVITGFVSSDMTGVTYSVNNAISSATSSFAVTLPDKPTVQPGLVVGLSDGSVYYWNGTVCTDATCVGPIVNGAEGVVVQNVDSPVSMAIAPNGNVYALGDDLTVIDSSTNTIITTIPIARSGGTPVVVISPDGFSAYATAALPNNAGLAVIDTTSNTVTAYVDLPPGPNATAVAISPDGTYGYILNDADDGGSPSLYQFDTTTNTLLSGVNVMLPSGGYGGSGLAFSADGASLYVSSSGDGNVYVIDTASNTVQQTIYVAGSPGAMALSPDGGHVFVAQTPNYDSNSVSIIDTSTNAVSNVLVGNGPAYVAFNPNPGLPFAYVSNSNDSTVSVIELATMSVIGTFATGAGGDDTLGIAVSADGINVYLANYDGGGNDYGTVPVYQVATPVAPGWSQLMPSNDGGVGINAIAALPNNNGFVIGNTDGFLATWNNPILADGTIVPGPGVNNSCSNGSSFNCWNVVPNNPMNVINAILPSGQTGGFVAIGTNGSSGDGWAQGFNGAATFGGGQSFGGEIPTTVLPYDGTTFVGSIGSAPVIAENGVISAPSYASQLPDLSASSAGCTGSYNSGSGAGCAGYVLTVQEAAGNSIRVGQALYGGPGLAPGTVVTEQISDGDGNLCSTSCNAGSTGVYLVNTSQVLAPGTPMSASDGTGFMIGTNNGSVFGWNNDIAVLVPADTWYSAVNAMIPWRDGFVVGLDNGAIMYWSPSNNPTEGSGPYLPLNGTSMALDYPGSTIPSQNSQLPGWSQLQGWTQECGCIGWGQSVTSMVPMGDGFAVGLTAPNDDSTNGAVQLFSGFGALSKSSAFGYLQTNQYTTVSGDPVVASTTVQALTPANVFTEIASQTALPGPNGSVGSIQQMVPITQSIKDSAGDWWNASSVVVGQTDNGINSWAGSNLTPAVTTWNQLQAAAAPPGQLDPTTLQGAWDFVTATTAPSGAFGAAGAVGGSTDPVFGQSFNQAWCGSVSSCNSQGDFQTFVFNYPFGDDGVIYSLGTTLEAELNMSAAGYGYLFVPAGILDKFRPDYYSAGLVLGVQGGPSVVLNPPPGVSIKDTVTASTSYTDTQDTEFGVFSETVGIDASLTGSFTLQTTSIPAGGLPLAYAYYTPGLMFTWNSAGNPDSLGMSYSAYSSTGYVSPSQLESYLDPTGAATVTATVTPYASVSYGLFTNTPIDLDIFKLTVGYQNPITAELTVPIADFDKTSLSLSAQGFLTASAAFIPGITSDLSWKGKYQLYSVKDSIQLANYI